MPEQIMYMGNTRMQMMGCYRDEDEEPTVYFEAYDPENYDQALARYFNIKGNGAPMPDQNLSDRNKENTGWQLANINGLLMFIADD